MRKYICSGLAVGLLMFGKVGLSQATSLIITGVIDGPLPGGTPKAVELYVINDIFNLSIYGLGFANNGGGSDGIEFTFAPASASSGDFLYVASDRTEFENFFGFTPDWVTSTVNMNGDDAIELFRNDAVVDLFGDIAKDGTGQPWEYLDGWAYRKDGAGGLDTAIFSGADWFFSGPNALDGAEANLTAACPFPTGSFAPALPRQPVPAPEPTTVLLLASGIAGLTGKRLQLMYTRRKFKKIDYSA